MQAIVQALELYCKAYQRCPIPNLPRDAQARGGGQPGRDAGGPARWRAAPRGIPLPPADRPGSHNYLSIWEP